MEVTKLKLNPLYHLLANYQTSTEYLNKASFQNGIL